jgi:dTDP-4-dehydrorhamnose 3,5-epimerase
MLVRSTSIDGVIVFVPTPHRDDRGFFTRTFDADIAAAHGLDPYAFVQDSQSRSGAGVLRGLHGRSGRGEAKLVRCARGAIHDVVVDARPDSPTFGHSAAFRLDDEQFWHLYIPPGMLHGFQVLTESADICYRIDRPHDPTEDVSVRFDDPELALRWPLPVGTLSARDSAAGSWAEFRENIRGYGVRPAEQTANVLAQVVVGGAGVDR